ncbi:MAG: beta-ketoacyl-ACP synthase III [Actinomycetota bacterium]
MPASITGWGTALPPRTLTNADLATRLGVDEEWIVERTGIHARHVANGQTTSTLAAAAGAEALARAEVNADEVDAVIVATVTPDYRFPAAACLVQSALGASRAAAFDLNAGCAGFLYGLAQATAMIESGACRRVLMCGADVLSAITDYTDPRSCILFGDGAGAVLVERVSEGGGLGPFHLRSDGASPELLYVPNDTGVISMHGREVYRRAVDAMARSVGTVLRESGATIDDVDLLVAHQANARILDAVAQRVGLPPEKVVMNIARYGNTSAASIPLALAEAIDTAMLRDGDLVVLAAFGAGFAWGAGIVRWGVGVGENLTLVGEASA